MERRNVSTPVERLRCVEARVGAIQRMVEEDATFSETMLELRAVGGELRAVARALAQEEARSRLEAIGFEDAARVSEELVGALGRDSFARTGR